MTYTPPPNSSPEETAPLQARIRLDAMRQNLRALRKRLPKDTRICAVVKTDGYGHGMAYAARVAVEEKCRFLAVLSVKEAAQLRALGFTADILIIGPIEPWQAAEAVRPGVAVFVGSLEVAEALDAAARAQGARARVHLKIDTGMGRFGFLEQPMEWNETIERLLALPNLEIEGAATHFSMADEPDSDFTPNQARRFRRALRQLEAKGIRPPWIHAANSAAILHFPDTAFSLVRPGIAIYGAYPGPPPEKPIELEPVMTLTTRIVDIRPVPAGTPVSYGRAFITRRPSRLALLPLGYESGYPRHASGNAEVIVRGKRAPLVGRITMSLTVADVTDVPDAAVGDTALVFGRLGDDLLRVEEVARAAETIPYEILCNVGRNVPRVFEEE